MDRPVRAVNADGATKTNIVKITIRYLTVRKLKRKRLTKRKSQNE